MVHFLGNPESVIVVLISIFCNENGVFCAIRWTGWNRYPSNNGFLPVSGGYKPDVTSKNRIACAEVCIQDKNCMSFVFVSDTLLCQLHMETWGVGAGVFIENSASYYILYNTLTKNCPVGWSAFGDSCYQVTTTHYNYTDSEAECNSLGASLVQIDHETENDFVTQLCKDNTVPGIHCWIATMETEVDNDWIFPTTGEPGVYFSWHPGEPNLESASNCIIINSGHVFMYMWTDDPCYLLAYSVCEING